MKNKPRRRLTLRSLGLSCLKLAADSFSLFAGSCCSLTAIGRSVNQLFQVSGKFWTIDRSDFTEQQFEFREDADVLAIAVIEELRTDSPVVDQCCRHVPIRSDHAKMTAVLAKHRVREVRHRLRVKFPKIPIAR